MGVSISEFRGEYYFLSNFYSAPVTYNGMCFENNEAALEKIVLVKSLCGSEQKCDVNYEEG